MESQEQKKSEQPADKLFVTDKTFNMYAVDQQTPITDMILESYGQVGVPEERAEEEQNGET